MVKKSLKHSKKNIRKRGIKNKNIKKSIKKVSKDKSKKVKKVSKKPIKKVKHSVKKLKPSIKKIKSHGKKSVVSHSKTKSKPKPKLKHEGFFSKLFGLEDHKKPVTSKPKPIKHVVKHKVRKVLKSKYHKKKISKASIKAKMIIKKQEKEKARKLKIQIKKKAKLERKKMKLLARKKLLEDKKNKFEDKQKMKLLARKKLLEDKKNKFEDKQKRIIEKKKAKRQKIIEAEKRKQQEQKQLVIDTKKQELKLDVQETREFDLAVKRRLEEKKKREIENKLREKKRINLKEKIFGQKKPVEELKGKPVGIKPDKVKPVEIKPDKVKPDKVKPDINGNVRVSKKEVSLGGKNGSVLKASMAKTKKFREEYVKTYIPGFDVLVTPGIPAGAAILVEGGPGSGKTIFCLELVKNLCAKGKKVLYMSFEEPEYRLKHHLESFGTNVDKYMKGGKLYIKRFNALDIARSVEALLSEAKKELLIDVQPVLIPKDFEPDIVLVDSLTSIGSAFTGEENRFRIYMEQLFRYLESHDITSFLIRETSNPTHIGHTFVEQGEAVSFLSDGIISLYNVYMESGKRKRALEVIKMRGTQIDRKIVECDIVGKKGLIVSNKVLTGKYKLT